jgi:translocation and assembly module TamA
LLSGLFKSTGYVLGGNRDYFKVDLAIQSYTPIGEKSVFATRIKFGRLWGWDWDTDYSYEKFYLGGSTSMRGWEVLRFKEQGDQPVGDIIRFMTNVEYRFPLYKSFGFTIFTDGGLLTDHTKLISRDFLKWNYGVGITILTPLGPARLDYAIQVNDPEERKIQLGVQNLF